MLGFCALLFFSCNNEDFLSQTEGGEPCDYICFSIPTDEGAQTKGSIQADAKEYTSDRFVLRSADSADTLCVRTIVSEGIQGAAADQAITRGTPITAEAFYDNFHVLTVRDQESSFFMNEDVTKTGNSWTMDNTYYWPGADHTLQFYAWAPANAITAAPTRPNNMTFTYTVPTDATEQQDLVVANESHEGDFNQVVSLPFQHICTAVKFVVGEQMQAGTITSVALKDVRYAGSYDMTTGQWSLTDEQKSFSQTLNKRTTGSEIENTEITPADGTFMMLPQTLPAGASVEVVFQDRATGSEHTLSATIGGTEWPMGSTVTYKLSITPEYEFKLDDTDKDKVLDAHFEIFKTNLIVSGVPDGQSWTISAPNFGDGTLNAVTIQAQSDMNTYSANQGFWTDRNFNDQGNDTGSARGESTYSGTGSGTFPIAIFVPENVGVETRNIELSIQVNGSNTNQTINFQQLSPSWFGNGNLGCERIEGNPAPWGFYWSEDYKLIYNLENCDDSSRRDIYTYVQWSKSLKTMSSWPIIGWIINAVFGDNIPDMSYVEIKYSGGLFNRVADQVTINLGQLQASGIALSTTDGQRNTRDVYNYQGIQYANTLISRLEDIGGSVKEEGTGINPTYNASIACMKLNSWNIYEAQDEYLLRLTNEDANPSWYLPASGEVSGITDTEYPLQGEYWSSTAENNNTNAYKYSAGGSTVLERRDVNLHVRAVRKKP